MKLKQFLMALVIAVFVVGVVAVPAAHANTKSTVTQSDTRPGWGNGDKNHHHVGPPGHSVRPGDGDNDKDDQGDDNDHGGNQNHHISQAQFKQFFAEFQQLFHKFFG